MKLMVVLLALSALGVGGLYYYEKHQEQCSVAGFGIIGGVTYCTRPDGSVYLKTPPTPSADPSAAPSAATP